MSTFNRFVKRSFRKLGLQIRWIPPRYACHLHPFPDQLGDPGRPPARSELSWTLARTSDNRPPSYRWLFPEAVIHSFEPDPEAFDELRRRTANDANTHPWQVAVSSVMGPVRFRSNRMSDTSSLLPTRSDRVGEAHLETQAVLEVESTTLDAFCSDLGILEASISETGRPRWRSPRARWCAAALAAAGV